MTHGTPHAPRVQVIERVERMAGASLYKGTRRADLNRLAEREARELDGVQGADSRLDLKVKVMVIGMTGGHALGCRRVVVMWAWGSFMLGGPWV